MQITDDRAFNLCDMVLELECYVLVKYFRRTFKESL